MKVAFLGAGLMGEPMAGHLLRAGFEVFVTANRNRQPIDRLVAAGATEVASPAAAAAATDVALMILPTSREVEAVLFGDNGLASGMRPNYLAVDMGTCYPADTKRLGKLFADVGGRFIDAPVTGGTEGARNGTLATMGGGDERAFEEVRPLLSAFSAHLYHFGALGSGHAAKLAQNMIGFVEVAAVAEGLALSKALGLDSRTFFEMLTNSHSNSPIIQWMVPKVFSGAFEAEARLDIAYKDMTQAVKMAREMTNLPLGIANAATEVFQMARALGFGDQDSVAVVRGFETILGEEIRVSQDTLI
ncbi:NAD(P)-dependent oxidoreductase [Rhizobium sp. KVB221]|uniref:NAD(P)-dependent oxidoreductase n=1 Tax=Rhizobium setariae TaxID=2801340 RepID=A0A936YPD5_9HYPH|nr:NAD(P)-dependent oxidoreductase [Rhizobium setariae]MBL0374339.1 NAD(P)-dependent oxidoreductase [Rhizobium setariae]